MSSFRYPYRLVRNDVMLCTSLMQPLSWLRCPK
jgi:hypothetical protein